jgi:hypothetical protein
MTQTHALSSANVQGPQYCGASPPFVNDCNEHKGDFGVR